MEEKPAVCISCMHLMNLAQYMASAPLYFTRGSTLQWQQYTVFGGGSEPRAHLLRMTTSDRLHNQLH